jgi:glucose-6-phosphate isomerase
MDLLHINLDDPRLLGRTLPDGRTVGAAMAALASEHPAPLDRLREKRSAWPIGWLELPNGGPVVDACIAPAKRLADQCDTLIVCGIGGSALGTQAVHAALDSPAKPLRKVTVLDNVDPCQVARLVREVNLRRCAINVISKSGETLETMAGFFYIYEKLRQCGLSEAQVAARIIVTTDQATGLLRRYATENGWTTLPVPGDVGGRFSVLSAVGLFPLAFAGVDVRALLDGARECQEQLAAAPSAENEAWRLAALHYVLHTAAGMGVTVQYIYGDPLVLLGDWWRQLWAESLAKARRLDGAPSGIGQTPVVARGATDQHSQNQLYFEGPDDKLYGLVSAQEWPCDMPLTVPGSPALAELRYVSGHTFGEILAACHGGVRDALRAASRPVYEITLPRTGAREVGAYLQLWMLAAAFAGQLYNVNPFDQPGVEKSKAITRQRLAQGGA